MQKLMSLWDTGLANMSCSLTETSLQFNLGFDLKCKGFLGWEIHKCSLLLLSEAVSFHQHGTQWEIHVFMLFYNMYRKHRFDPHWLLKLAKTAVTLQI